MNKIFSPTTGKAISIKDVHDPVFSNEILGKGLAIEPEIGEIVAPAEGKISMVADTKHCVGMVLNDGVELLIHVGLDTTKLNGKYFKPLVKSGQHVKKGDPLLKFNLKKLSLKGYDTVIPVIINNPDKAGNLKMSYGNVSTNDTIIETER